MNARNEIASRLVAAFGALAITATLLVSSFATAPVHTVASIIA
ncbi:hypothetical protein [Altererythrobacter sp. B11]|nr:hypothetical protein [Altererythrobacter sp. B11]